MLMPLIHITGSHPPPPNNVPDQQPDQTQRRPNNKPPFNKNNGEIPSMMANPLPNPRGRGGPPGPRFRGGPAPNRGRGNFNSRGGPNMGPRWDGPVSDNEFYYFSPPNSLTVSFK